jgi:hypothetical protein
MGNFKWLIVSILYIIISFNPVYSQEILPIDGEPVNISVTQETPIINPDIVLDTAIGLTPEDVDALREMETISLAIDDNNQPSADYKATGLFREDLKSCVYIPATIKYFKDKECTVPDNDKPDEYIGFFSFPMSGFTAFCNLPPANKCITIDTDSYCKIYFDFEKSVKCTFNPKGCIAISMKITYTGNVPFSQDFSFCFNTSNKKLEVILNSWFNGITKVLQLLPFLKKSFTGVAEWTEGGKCIFDDEKRTGFCTIDTPTAVKIASFDAKPTNNSVTIVWETGSEDNNFGFNIYRTELNSSTYVKINDAVIFSKTGSGLGATYTYVDTKAQNWNTYLYKLEDIDVNGTATMHGPVIATPKLLYGLFQE